jgi:hypothetical protein
MGRKSSAKRQRRKERVLKGEPETHGGASRDTAIPERIQEVERELMRLSGGRYRSRILPDISPQDRLSYLEDMLAFESVESGTSLFHGLEENGVKLPRPEELSEHQCGRKAMEILEALGNLRILLLGWEHMSPRELYSTLWHQTLWEGCYVEKRNPGAITLIDVSRSMSQADMRRFLEDLQKGSRVH